MVNPGRSNNNISSIHHQQQLSGGNTRKREKGKKQVSTSSYFLFGEACILKPMITDPLVPFPTVLVIGGDLIERARNKHDGTQGVTAERADGVR